MEIINLGNGNTVLNRFIAEIRDRNIQKDPMRFRRNLERIGEICAYEISKTLDYTTKDVETPLGIARCSTPDDAMVLGTILRAGLPIHQGILNYFDRAQNAFISIYRKYSKDNSLKIMVESSSSPSIDGKVLILADTMTATGASLIMAYRHLLEKGTPKQVHLVCAIASESGMENIQKTLGGENITVWVCAVDEELTSKSFIVPGLGDAGDLAFGNKHE